MKCKIVKLSRFSGAEASVYSVIINDSQTSLFENFIQENINSHASEIKNIGMRLITIGKDTGARYSFFKHKEGVPGDGVVALYDDPDKKLRLYGIRYGNDILILGGGGPKNVAALQEDEKLKEENYLIRAISAKIAEKIKEKEIKYSDNNLELEGELEFEIDDNE
jgi:hypothetical protein